MIGSASFAGCGGPAASVTAGAEDSAAARRVGHQSDRGVAIDRIVRDRRVVDPIRVGLGRVELL